MSQRDTDRTVVEHVVETDGRGNQRIGARRVADDGLAAEIEDGYEPEATAEDDARARLTR
jgi:hypothetical protein